MQIYSIWFLPAEKYGANIKYLNGDKAGNNGGNESVNIGQRRGDDVTPSSLNHSDYIQVWIKDNDTTFNEEVKVTTNPPEFQSLLDELTIGGTTYPAGTSIHSGYQLDIDTDGNGVADLSIWPINVTTTDRWGSPVQVTVGVASSKPPPPPGSKFIVVGGAQSADADISDPSQMFCFAAGTLIATPGGERAVETMAPGDEVTTADGRAVPVRWIGRQSVRRAAASGRMAPVRIAQGALGGGLPRRDLVVTADHALILDGLAITAGALVDGRGIRRVAAQELPERATFYHIETEAHDVVLAEGAPSETWVDHAERARFDNYDEYLRLHGADRRIMESPLPRITAARQLPLALRLKLGLGGASGTAAQASAA